MSCKRYETTNNKEYSMVVPMMMGKSFSKIERTNCSPKPGMEKTVSTIRVPVTTASVKVSMMVTSEGNTECHQLSKKAMGKIPSFKPSQYCVSGASTKSGTETPSTARNAAPLSQMLFCLRALTMPRKSPTTSPTMIAWVPRKMETGSRSRMMLFTGLPPYWYEVPRSPRSRPVMYRAYWTGRGLSRLYSSPTCASCSAVSFSAFCMGEPGRSCMRNQVAVVTMNSTMTAFSRRLSMYFSMPSPHRGPEDCGRTNPLLRDSAAIRVLLSLYSRVLPVGAAEGVVPVVLEIRLPHAGEHREVHGDSSSLLDQDLLRLQHVLHAQLQVRCGLSFLYEPVVFFVLEERVVERRVREIEVHEGHRVVVVTDPAEGVVDLVVLRVHPVQRGIEGHDLHVEVRPQVLFVLVLHVGRYVPLDAVIAEEHRQLGLLANLLDALLPQRLRRIHVLGHEVAVGLPEGLVTGSGRDRRRDEAVGGQRTVLEYLLGELLPVEADHDRFADVEVVQPWRLLVKPPVDGKGQREPEEVGAILELLDLVTL